MRLKVCSAECRLQARRFGFAGRQSAQQLQRLLGLPLLQECLSFRYVGLATEGRGTILRNDHRPAQCCAKSNGKEPKRGHAWKALSDFPRTGVVLRKL